MVTTLRVVWTGRTGERMMTRAEWLSVQIARLSAKIPEINEIIDGLCAEIEYQEDSIRYIRKEIEHCNAELEKIQTKPIEAVHTHSFRFIRTEMDEGGNEYEIRECDGCGLISKLFS